MDRAARQERQEIIIEALRAGQSREKVAADAGCKVAIISAIARNNSIGVNFKRDQIIAETLADHTIQETADRLGMSYPAVRAIGLRLGVTPPAGYHYGARRPLIIDAAREHGIEAAARQHGITHQRVVQIIQKYEKATGEHIQRRRRKVPSTWPQTLLCPNCRYPAIIRNANQFLRYSQCLSCSNRIRQSSCFTHENVEQAISERLSGGRRWHRIAVEDFNIPRHRSYSLTRAAFIQLRRAGRRGEIERLWPKGIPNWLQKYDR